MLAETRSRRIVETGGGLFGYLAGADVVVEEISVAAGQTRRAVVRFHPDVADLQARLDEVLGRSEGSRHLVGEWHTHPWGAPYLSRTDKASIRAAAENDEVGLPNALAIVLAPTLLPQARIRLAA